MQVLEPAPDPEREPQRIRLEVGRGTWATWLLIGLPLAYVVAMASAIVHGYG